MNSKSIRNKVVWLAVFAAIGVALWWLGSRYLSGTRQRNTPASAGIIRAVTTPSNQVASTGATNAVMSNEAVRMKLFAGFRKRPFAVTQKSADYQWTAEDGKQPAAIRQLAHNELEYERLAEESTRILRRQLVYALETADQLVQLSRLSGEPIRQLTLPGLDGKEFQVEITQADLNPSGQQGTFSGHLVGRLDSMVTFAFKGGREAFTVLSPSDNTYLVGEPREPGELIVKSINPDTYVVGVCGNP